MSTQAQLSLFSPIKVNLYLRIVGKRPDGYHDLETVMAPLDFGDTLAFAPAERGITMSCDNPALPTGDTNLVVRAAKKLAERFTVTRGAHIALTKRAPLAAGVGGGSSNAAFTLLGLNKLWQLGATDAQLGEIAATLGSDINFFMAGGAALCRGRGEQVVPVLFRLKAFVLLVNPGFGISTKWAYESWAKAASVMESRGALRAPRSDPMPNDGRTQCATTTKPELPPDAASRLTPTESGLTAQVPDVTLLLRSLAENDLAGASAALYNSLEAPSVGKFPVLDLLKRAMRAEGAAGALMSGSGASVFGLFADAADAERAAEKVRAEFGPSMWTRVCEFGCPVV